MKYKIHRSLAEQIREGCEGRLNIRLRAGWFSFGNVYPDVSHQRISICMRRIPPAGWWTA